MGGRGNMSSFFRVIHVRIGTRIDISISQWPPIWQTCTSREVDLNETNQIGAVDAIMPRSHDKLKTLNLHYNVNFGHPFGRGAINHEGVQPM